MRLAIFNFVATVLFLVMAVVCSMQLTGCATIDAQLENAIAPALACDKVFIVSQYGPLGISSKVRDSDAKIICDNVKGNGNAKSNNTGLVSPAAGKP